MKRKILSIVLSLVMVLTMMPAMGTAAYAETPEEDYLTFTSSKETTVSFANWPDGMNLQYSTDGGDSWNDADAATTITLGNGKTVKFKGDNGDIFTDNNYLKFKMESSTGGTIAASGSVMSLFANKTECMPYCCYDWFKGCTILTDAPKLPAMTLAEGCYAYMFDGCTGLTKAPELPTETLAKDCYRGMFWDCINLTEAPKLPAMTLADGCYWCMFDGCTGLTKAPELPAKSLEYMCYYYMFARCTNLSKAPELPAETLAKECYFGMFSKCTNLTQAPELPAETLADSCYAWMFLDCTSLTEVPELPATYLPDGCYYSMFYKCSNIKVSEDSSGYECYSEFIIPAEYAAENSLYGMFYKTGGTFTDDPVVNTTYYVVHEVHDLTKNPSKKATFTADGNTEYWTCNNCEKFFADEAATTEISKAGVIPKATASISKTAFIYNGKTQKPAVTVKDSKGNVIKSVTVTNAGRKYVGKGTVKVVLSGDYSDTKTFTYKINPKQAAVSKATPGKKKLTVKMGSKVSATGGATYQIAYKQKGTSKWKYTTTTKQSKVIKKLKKGKRYYVKVRAYKTVSKVKYYGAWSKTKLSKKIK